VRTRVGSPPFGCGPAPGGDKARPTRFYFLGQFISVRVVHCGLAMRAVEKKPPMAPLPTCAPTCSEVRPSTRPAPRAGPHGSLLTPLLAGKAIDQAGRIEALEPCPVFSLLNPLLAVKTRPRQSPGSCSPSTSSLHLVKRPELVEAFEVDPRRGAGPGPPEGTPRPGSHANE
jgi:hypothetical protein